MKNLIELYDTTWRDGAQTEGISYSAQDKIRIAQKLDFLGIHYIEGGWPANIKDKEFFKLAKKTKFENSHILAFGSTRRADKKAQDDDNIKGLLAAETKYVIVFGKSWDMHVKEILRVSLDENLKMIEETIKYLISKGRKVFYDAEHFFDAYKANPDYALKTLLTAQDAGASCITLCDTNGGSLTSEVIDIIKQVKAKLNSPLGIHTHNDLGLAVANSIAAVQAGCTQIQGTFNGYGERCGNANLATVIGILKTKMEKECIPDVKLKHLTEVSHYVSEVSNMKQEDNQPFVGRSAFAHKGGVHIDAVLKNPQSYEHVDPHIVGNRRRILTSELAGKTSLVKKAKELEFDLDKKSPKARKLHRLIQDLENQGYQFEAAEASFEILLKKALGKYKKFFDLKGFRVIVEKRKDDKITSEATIEIKVNKLSEHTAAQGDGPVNALDNALRKALKSFYPNLTKMHLSDFKVRVLDAKAGTAAKVRVLIESQDEKDSWNTVGVHENIIEASWQALVDSIEYKLLKDKSDKKTKE
jgi:2-isopropylmalate synthase